MDKTYLTRREPSQPTDQSYKAADTISPELLSLQRIMQHGNPPHLTPQTLLTLQRHIGNQALLRLVKRPSSTQQLEVKRGISSGAAIQRLDSMNNPAPNSPNNSQQVPDLSQANVDDYNQMLRSNEDDKELKAIEIIFNVLIARDPEFEDVFLQYNENFGDAYATAETGVGEETGEDYEQITVGPSAIDAGLPILYSSLRHEFIHIAQFRKNSSESDDESPHIFGEMDEEQKYVRGAQEIETYTWEIMNARRTGIAANEDFVKGQVNGLIEYWNFSTYPMANRKPQGKHSQGVSKNYQRTDGVGSMLRKAKSLVIQALDAAVELFPNESMRQLVTQLNPSLQTLKGQDWIAGAQVDPNPSSPKKIKTSK